MIKTPKAYSGRKVSGRYREAQASYNKDNSKFIPFFTAGANNNDWRIAYFIAHLRTEVNRHKGTQKLYRASKPVWKDYGMYTAPVPPAIVRALTAKRVKIDTGLISKNIFELDYVGNIRFLMTPASMEKGSALYDEWLRFFCDLKLYINNKTRNSGGALEFVKTLQSKNTSDSAEYKFAVAVVQTFLNNVDVPDDSGVAQNKIEEPDKWAKATSITYISGSEAIFRLFAPGKIYNRRRITAKIPKLNIRNKYYITQKGGTPQLAQELQDNITALLDDLNVLYFSTGRAGTVNN
jgi:hypothetical protein